MNSWRDDLYSDMLMHDGQKGMKWGRRRYRNYDGTLTPAGRERYGVGTTAQNAVKKLSRKERKAQKEIKRKASAKAAEKAAKQATEESKRAAEEARQAQEELKKAQEAAAAEAEKKAKEAKAGHATAEENMQAKLDNDRLREQINALKLEREYESLVRPKNQTPQKKTMMEKALAFVDTAKKVTTAANDVYKMIEDIKKGFKGESDYDRLKKQSDMDKLKYDMETRDRSRKKWADDDAKAAADKASSEAKEKADRDSAARTANQEAADRWAAAQVERASGAYGSNNRSGSFFTEPWRDRSVSTILALPPGRGEQAVKDHQSLPASSILSLPSRKDSGLNSSGNSKSKSSGLYKEINVHYTDADGSSVAESRSARTRSGARIRRKKNDSINHSENLDEFLEHHGILGMKWGVRRYQNKDGTLTAAGKKRFTNANREKRDRLLQVRKQDLLKGKSGSFSAMSELAKNILDTEFTSKQINDIEHQYCRYLQSTLQAKNLEHVNEEMYQEKPEGITAIDFVRANNVLFEMNDQRDKSFERWQETFRKDYLDKVGLPKEKLDKVGPLAEGVFREALEASLNKTPLATAQMRGAPKESAIDFASGERKHGDPNDRLYVSSDAYEIEEYENRHGKGSYQELIDHFKKG